MTIARVCLPLGTNSLVTCAGALIAGVSLVAIIVSLVIVVLVSIAVVCCIYRHRVRQQERQRSAVLYSPTQIPQVNVQHHYTPVNQSQPQEQRFPPQGYSAPPQQTQTYTQPSAPTAYPYPSGQEVYPPQTATSAHQNSKDTGEPPTYEEDKKRKI